MARAKLTSPAYVIESVDNALTILRMLCDSRRLRVSDVAKRLGVSPSTAHRLLSMLVHHGYGKQARCRGEYSAGPLLLDPGMAAMREQDIRLHVRPVLEELLAATNETVHVAVPYGRDIMYIDGLVAQNSLHIGLRVGRYMLAHCVGAGVALLATLPREEFRRLYPNSGPVLRALTGQTPTTIEELERLIARVRRCGFARSRSEIADGVGSVAVAVVDRDGIGRAAFSIAAPTSQTSPEGETHWAHAAKGAAAKLHARLWGMPATICIVSNAT